MGSSHDHAGGLIDRRPVLAAIDADAFRHAVTEALEGFGEACRGVEPADSLGDAAWARLHAHYRLLRRWNQRIGLIGRGSVADAAARHYAESLAGLGRLPPEPCLDIGSGGGFPGLVLAACRPHQDFLLVESRQRKAAFLHQAAASMGLERCRVVADRWGRRGLNGGSALERFGSSPTPFGALVARAVDLKPWIDSLQAALTHDAVWLAWGPGAQPDTRGSAWVRVDVVPLAGERQLSVWRREAP